MTDRYHQVNEGMRNQAIGADQTNVNAASATLSSDEAKQTQDCAGTGASAPACSQDGPTVSQDQSQLTQADGQLAGYHLLTATRADFLRRLGRLEEAAASYREALDMTATEPERRFLSRRLDEVTAGS